MTDSQITERHPDGTVAVRLEPVPAFLTAKAMDNLHRGFTAARSEGRLLTLLLLYHASYGVGRFISHEKVVEDLRRLQGVRG